MRASQIRFIQQQGFPGETFPDSLYRALMLQPKIVGVVVALGVLLQSGWPFQIVSADAIYNQAIAYRRGLLPLAPAPAPRRVAAGEAGAIALAAGVALSAGATTTAAILEGALIAGVISAVFGDFCIPAYTYHLLRRLSPRQAAFDSSKG